MFTPVTQPEEIRQVADLAKEIWTPHYLPIIGREQVDYMLSTLQSETAIQEQIRNGMKYFLMENQAGYFAYERKPDHLFLSKIYVQEKFRGKGIARRAIAWMQATESPPCIRLTVNRHNTGSLKAYHRLGFQTVAEQVTDIGRGFVMDDFVLERPGIPLPSPG